MRYIIFSLILLSTLTFANQTKKISLQLSWLHQFQFAGYYMAKELGYYKDAGIDLEIKEFQFGLNVSSEIENKKADFGIGRSTLLVDRFNGKDIVIIAAIFQKSPLMLLVKKDSGINKIEDLYNKNIMITDDAKSSASIISMLSSNGITEHDINLQKHSFNLDDLINNKTDAMASYVSNEPIRLEEKKIPYKIFHPKDFGFRFYDDILFTSSEFIKKNPTLTQNFYKATIKGWEYAFKNKIETAKLIYKKYNTQKRTVMQLIKEAQVLEKLAFDVEDSEIGCIDEDVLKNISNTYKILGFISDDINYDEFIYKHNHHKAYTFKLSNKDIIYSSVIAVIFILGLLFFIVYTSIRKKWLVTQEQLTDDLNIKTKSLSEEKELFLKIFNKLPYCAVISSGIDMINVNKSTLKFFGFNNKDEMLEKHTCITDFFIEKEGYIQKKIKEENWILHILDNPGKYKALVKKDKKNHIFNIEISKFRFSFEDRYLILLTDITKETKEYEVMKYKMEYDSLTKIYNRNKLNELLSYELIRQSRADNYSMSLVLIDIDFFKKVNDNYGHLIGDVTLFALSRLIKENKRDSDILGRWGGEEFVLILLETKIEKAFVFVEKLRKIIEEKRIPQVGSITCSFGITQYKPKDTINSIFKRCDDALYEAKEAGRNKAVSK